MTAVWLLIASPAASSPTIRDVVLGAPNPSAAFASSTAPPRRYPVGDRDGRSATIAVTEACRLNCTAANPEKIAAFLGTLPHASEMNLLNVQLSTPRQIATTCGAGVQACYYPYGDRMVVSGNDTVAADYATREFVIAHEYGHHVANHRPAPRPDAPAIAWGTPRWASYEGVCKSRNRYRYFHNPGEAFAEAFAFNRFPDTSVNWAWKGSFSDYPKTPGRSRSYVALN